MLGRPPRSTLCPYTTLFRTGYAVRDVSRARSVRRLRDIVAQFSKTEQYLMLKRLIQVMAEESGAETLSRQPLGTLIGRYPYLYEHCLLSEESPKEQQTHVRRMQRQAQKKVELDLSQYVNYRVRRSRLKREGRLERQRDRKFTRLNSSHPSRSRMPSSA